MTNDQGAVVDSIAPFYADWRRYNERVIDHLRGLSAEDLGLRAPGLDHWPIWAIAAHTVGARVYWLCHVFGEPGVETTPFPDPTGLGWEDELEVVRSGDEVVGAWDRRGASSRDVSTAGPPTASTRLPGGRTEGHRGAQPAVDPPPAHHPRGLSRRRDRPDRGIHGRPQLDLWPARDWLIERR
jgi:hypothetical protein